MPQIGSTKRFEDLIYTCRKITGLSVPAYRYADKWRNNGHKARVEIIPATRTHRAVYVVYIWNKYEG